MQSGVDPNHLRVPLHSPIADAYTFHPPPHPHGHPHPVVGRPRTPPRTPPRRSSRTPPPHTVSRPFDYAIAADGSIITVPLQAHQHTPITIGAYPSPLPVPLPAPLPPPPVELTPMQRLFEDGGLPVEFTQPPHPPTTTTDDTSKPAMLHDNGTTPTKQTKNQQTRIVISERLERASQSEERGHDRTSHTHHTEKSKLPSVPARTSFQRRLSRGYFTCLFVFQRS